MFLILNHNDDDEDWETRPAQARLASSCLFNYSKLQLQLPCNFLQPCRNDDLDANTKIHENRNKKIHGRYKNTKIRLQLQRPCNFLQPCTTLHLSGSPFRNPGLCRDLFFTISYFLIKLRDSAVFRYHGTVCQKQGIE